MSYILNLYPGRWRERERERERARDVNVDTFVYICIYVHIHSGCVTQEAYSMPVISEVLHGAQASSDAKILVVESAMHQTMVGNLEILGD